jgi:outer membrane protein OmpA-like peptidoglycan-associated protein
MSSEMPRSDRRSFLLGLSSLALIPASAALAGDIVVAGVAEAPANPWAGRELTAFERLRLGAFKDRLNDNLAGLQEKAIQLDNHVRLRVPAATLFVPGRDALTADGVAIVTLVAERLNASKKIRVEIVAHHDTRATDYEAAVFTKRRATAVLAALESRGIKSHRLKATGAGKKFPYVEGASLANQRIEFIFRPL